MAEVTGFTADRMKQIEDTSIVEGEVNEAGDLILSQRDGTPINAGRVYGDTGLTGPQGPQGEQGIQGLKGDQGDRGNRIFYEPTEPVDVVVGDVWAPSPALPAEGVVASPVGAVTMFAGATAPTGWLICDGSAVLRAKYPMLFLTIGTTYGSGDGSTTFNIPNLVDRFVLGAGSRTLNAYGGEENTAITTANIPAHDHGASTGAHGHSGTATDAGAHGHWRGDGDLTGATDTNHLHDLQNHSHPAWTDTQGSYHAHGGSHVHAGNSFTAGGTNGLDNNIAGGDVNASNPTHAHGVGIGAAEPNNTGWVDRTSNHSHSITPVADHEHSVTVPSSGGDHTHNSVGTGTAPTHNNMPPYRVMNFIIRAVV